MPEDQSQQVTHNVEFLTGGEVRQVDDDPVLERRDMWRGERQ